MDKQTKRGEVRRAHQLAALTIAGLLTVIMLVPFAAAGDEIVGEPQEGPTRRSAEPWSPEAEENYSDEELAAVAEATGSSKEEALQRRRIERETPILERLALERWPDSFSGLWITPTGPATVVAAFTEDAEQRVEELRRHFSWPDLLTAKTHQTSLVALLGRQQIAMSDREAVRSGDANPKVPPALVASGGRYDLDIDVANNRLVIHVARFTAEDRRAAQARYGDTHFREDVAVPDCTRTDCRYSMRGGLRLTWSSGYCSSAFTAYDSTYSYVLSAGHCSAETGYPPSRANGGSTYGSVAQVAYHSRFDAEKIRRTNSAWGEHGVVWMSSSDQRAVTYYIRYSDITLGTVVTMSGATTGTSSGSVSSKTFAPSYVPNAEQRFMLAGYCRASGDSGGAVMRSNTAWGIHSGGTASCTGIFGSVEFAIQGLGVNLLSSNGLPVGPTPSPTPSPPPPPPGCTVGVLGICIIP